MKIKKDAYTIKYIKIIRDFDSTLSIGSIKRRIEESKEVLRFDLEYYDVLEELNRIDRKRVFRDMIDALYHAGASISIYQNGDPISITLLDNWLTTIDETRRGIKNQQDIELNQ